MNIVAPAGNMERFYAAIKGGAQEIYMGLKGFGARRNAQNFTLSEYIEALEYAHERGVKVFLTLNTIMKDVEIEALYPNVKKLYENGLDAIIVQDLGLFRFLRENFPDIDLHGSTQMSVANHVEANYLKEIGFSRVVTARELSFEEIKSIRKQSDIELEIFVSGALCISYSGNCYLSSFIGGRSGNRGLCAQPCRKIYKEEEKKDGYSLSPKDQMMGLDEIKMLKKLGIESIKVEGRMKSPEYVYETVNYYKNLIDEIPSEAKSKRLFNRGYSKGYFYNNHDLNIMNSKYSSDFGSLIGEIKNGYVKLEEDVMLGDGISFISSDYHKLGGEYLSKLVVDGTKDKRKVASRGEKIKLLKGNIPKGSKYVYRNLSKKDLDEAATGIKNAKRQMPIEARFVGEVGSIVTLEVCAINNRGQKIEAMISTDTPLEAASKRVLEPSEIAAKLSETGDTTYYIDGINIEFDGKAFLPVSVLKGLKRDVLSILKERLLESYIREARETPIMEEQEYIEKSELGVLIVVDNEKQRKFVRSLGYENIFLRQVHVAREGTLEKIDVSEGLATTMYHVLSRNEGTVVNWNLNISNTYALKEISKVEGVETVILSTEINYDTLRNIGEASRDGKRIKKALVVYGKLLGMLVELPLTKDGDREIVNEQGDKFVMTSNALGNTEITLDKPMNIISRLDEIEKAGIDEVVVEFTGESLAEIEDILESIKTRSGAYNPYNYERGAY